MEDCTIPIEDKLHVGDRIVTDIDDISMGVFNVGGELYAYENKCCNQGGPVCEGSITGTLEASYNTETLEVDEEWVKDGEVLVCPRCRWEYDITTGECLSNAAKKLKSFAVSRDEGNILAISK